MKVTIDRAKWNTAERHGSGCLLNGDNQSRCCLGFLAQECGVPTRAARNTGLPSETDDFVSSFPPELFEYSGNVGKYGGSYEWEGVFADLNDCKSVDDATRESWIAAGFRIVLGVEVEFVGEYP